MTTRGKDLGLKTVGQGTSGSYAARPHQESTQVLEEQKPAAAKGLYAGWSITPQSAFPGFGKRKPIGPSWLASSRGGSFSFTSEEAARAFIASPRGQAINPGPKPSIFHHTEAAVELVLETPVALGRISQNKVTILGRALNEQSRLGLRQGIRQGIHLLTGHELPPEERLPPKALLRVTAARRAQWAASVLKDETLSSDERVGQLFAGLAISGKHGEFRFRS